MFPYIVAQIFALVYLAIGLRLLIQSDFYVKLLKNMESNEWVSLLYGILGIVLGFVLLAHPDLGFNDWTVLLTIVGFIALLKGFAYLLFPAKMMKVISPLVTKNSSNFMGLICLGLAILFGFFGFSIFVG